MSEHNGRAIFSSDDLPESENGIKSGNTYLKVEKGQYYVFMELFQNILVPFINFI